MKKCICTLICLGILCTTLVSCDNKDETSKETGSLSQTSEVNIAGYDKNSGRYVADLPQFKWDTSSEEYKTFDVLVYSNEVQTTYFSEEIGYDLYTTTDEALNEGVRNRNNYVNEKTGVTIAAHPVKDVAETLRLDTQSGVGEYDAAMPFMAACVSMAQEGSLHELTQFSDYIDLSMPWWDQNATETFSISDKVYFTTGDISIMHKIVSGCVTFNKKMYAELFPGEDTPYDMVKKGTWTFDKMVELAKKATIDNGDGVRDYNDKWGFNGSYGNANGLYFGAGQTYSSKDENDIPVLTIGDEKSISVAQHILDTMSRSNEWIIFAQEFGTNSIWETSVKVFGENRALFMGNAFSAIKKFRKFSELDFGIVPEPKYDESQEKYCTPCSAGMAYGIVIPISAVDPEFSAYMIEITCCEGKNYVSNAWYETILKTREASDKESEEMIDLIFNNVVYDTVSVYNITGISGIFDKLVKERSTNIVSELDAVKGSANAAIEKIVEDYDKNS